MLSPGVNKAERCELEEEFYKIIIKMVCQGEWSLKLDGVGLR